MLWETSWEPFCTSPSSFPEYDIGEKTDSHPVKTIKKKKYRFHCFIECSVEVSCIVTVILENIIGNINSPIFTYAGRGEGEMYCGVCMFADA